MKIVLVISLQLLLLTVNFSCFNDIDLHTDRNCTRGNGSIISENRTMGSFNSITNTIYGDVFLTQGTQEDIIIEAQPNILRELRTEVINGELRVTFDRCVDIDNKVNIYITIPEIKSLVLTGVGDFIAQNEFQLTNLNVILTGVGDFNLMGTANEMDVTLTGVGNVNAFTLITDMCNVILTGVGNVESFVNNELNVSITGNGSVFYKGNPVINSTITGVGNVINSN